MTNVVKKTLIVEIDNVLSDTSHRQSYLEGDKPNFVEYARQSRHDRANMQVIEEVRRAKKRGFHVTIVTGRSDLTRPDTVNWLRQYNVPYDELIMRPRSIMDADDVFKRRIVSGIKDAVAAVDASDNVLSAYRGMGLRTFKASDGRLQGSLDQLAGGALVENRFLKKVAEMRGLL
jgi:hypothetical protein